MRALTEDFTVDLGDGELIELAAAPGMSILLRAESGGEEVDVAVTPARAELLITALQAAVAVADRTV